MRRRTLRRGGSWSKTRKAAIRVGKLFGTYGKNENGQFVKISDSELEKGNVDLIRDYYPFHTLRNRKWGKAPHKNTRPPSPLRNRKSEKAPHNIIIYQAEPYSSESKSSPLQISRPPSPLNPSIKVFSWNIEIRKKENRALVVKAIVESLDPCFICLQETATASFDHYEMVKGVSDAAAIYFKPTKYKLQKFQADNFTIASSDSRGKRRPYVLGLFENIVSKNKIVVGSVWLAHHVNQYSWQQFTDIITTFALGENIILGGDFNEAITNVGVRFLGFNNFSPDKVKCLPPPDNTCCSSPHSSKTDMFFSNLHCADYKVLDKNDCSDHSAIMASFHTG